MMRYVIGVDGKEYEVEVSTNKVVTVKGNNSPIGIQSVDTDTYSVLIDNISTHVTARQTNSGFEVLLGSTLVDVIVETERDRLLKRYATSFTTTSRRYEVHAPMPALVVRVEVAVGDEVKDGQGLVILEAMKMENEIKSHQSGRVKEIYVSQGKPVDKGELLMLLE